jgi:hypothetical protein
MKLKDQLDKIGVPSMFESASDWGEKIHKSYHVMADKIEELEAEVERLTKLLMKP